METEEDLEPLLDFLNRARGFDFTGYKRPSLRRRIAKRMEAIRVEGFDRYIDHLEVDPDEFGHLFNTILINVTGFFRDPQVWSYIETDVVPAVIKASDGGPIRVWSAACASGEEAYSIAMLLAEALGKDQFVERVRIYGTDVDEQALTQARQGAYSEKSIDGVPAEMQRSYFHRQGAQFVFERDIRRSLIFGRHDLVRDVAISRIDLLLCRNVLMYFNAETQAKVMTNLLFALKDDGFLVLGKSEVIGNRFKAFAPVDLRFRTYAKASTGDAHEKLIMLARSGSDDAATRLAEDIRDRAAAFESGPLAQLVIDRRGILTMANAHARSQLAITLEDLGRPFMELEVSYQPVELRGPIDEVKKTLKPTVISGIRHGAGTGEIHLDIDIVPLLDNVRGFAGVSVTFRDVTSYASLHEELEQSSQELETAMEELQSTNEELETTNEELQSTNEELETTNEELQSTNEELETMNEELQSTNEELGTVNDELRDRSAVLNQTNAFLQSILSSMRTAVIVVDRSMVVTEWNAIAEDLWGLHTNEVRKKPFLNLDIGLRVDELRPFIKACLEGEAEGEVTLSAMNRRGKTIDVRVQCAALKGSDGTTDGVILFMEPADKPAAETDNPG